MCMMMLIANNNLHILLTCKGLLFTKPIFNFIKIFIVENYAYKL